MYNFFLVFLPLAVVFLKHSYLSVLTRFVCRNFHVTSVCSSKRKCPSLIPVQTISSIHFRQLMESFYIMNLLYLPNDFYNTFSHQVSHDLRSYERNLSNCIQKPEKVRTSTGPRLTIPVRRFGIAVYEVIYEIFHISLHNTFSISSKTFRIPFTLFR